MGTATERAPDSGTTGTGSRAEVDGRGTKSGGRRRRGILVPARRIAGVVAAALATAALLAAAIVATGRNALWMAAGAGILVGRGVRIFEKDDGFLRGLVGATLALACCIAGEALANGFAGARRGEIALADIVFRADHGAASAMIGSALRPARLASDAVAVAIGYVVVREERFEESLLRLMARHRH